MTAFSQPGTPLVRVFDGMPLTPQVYDDPTLLPADPRVLTALRRRVEGADLAAPPVVLPDFHHKSKMELPSSVAVATEGTIRPTLTGSSVNCGMALMSLDLEPPDERSLSAFMRAVRERYPYPTRGRRDLRVSEVYRAAGEGADFAAERWGTPAADIERIEEFGRLDLEPYGGIGRLRSELPTLAAWLACYRFGTIGPSNHFVELQRVEEIFDEQTAAELGVRQGQLTIQYHGGGGVFTGEIGRLFGRRKDYPRQIRAVNKVLKPWFHLRTARSMAQLRERLSLYFQAGCPPVTLDSDEGQRLMLANHAAMNYGFAFRLATYATLRQLAAETFGGALGRLVVDSPHNSIYSEQLGSGTALVHRHNSCRAFPPERMPAGTTFARTGQAVLLPGTHRTSSYLAVAGDESANSLHSACHGAGSVISDLLKRGVSGPDPRGRSTLRFRYDDGGPSSVAQVDDQGVNAALAVLVRNGLVRPVARMRPLAVLH